MKSSLKKKIYREAIRFLVKNYIAPERFKSHWEYIKCECLVNDIPYEQAEKEWIDNNLEKLINWQLYCAKQRFCIEHGIDCEATRLTYEDKLRMGSARYNND